MSSMLTLSSGWLLSSSASCHNKCYQRQSKIGYRENHNYITFYTYLANFWFGSEIAVFGQLLVINFRLWHFYYMYVIVLMINLAVYS